MPRLGYNSPVASAHPSYMPYLATAATYKTVTENTPVNILGFILPWGKSEEEQGLNVSSSKGGITFGFEQGLSDSNCHVPSTVYHFLKKKKKILSYSNYSNK